MKNKEMILIKSVALEGTRRCNAKCDHCMRGEPQNLDMSREVIDNLLERKNIVIMKLIFSGGEPLLNEDLIIYTIDKIISNKKLVFQIEITTNGTIYSSRVVEKLKEFKEYLKSQFSDFLDTTKDDKISCIRISNDQFHQVNSDVLEKYKQEKELSVIKTGNIDILDDGLLLTGRAKNKTFGRDFEYHLKAINVRTIKKDKYFLENDFYITARGDITTQGDGTYEDMDIINLGPIKDFKFIDKKKEKLKKYKKLLTNWYDINIMLITSEKNLLNF